MPSGKDPEAHGAADGAPKLRGRKDLQEQPIPRSQLGRKWGWLGPRLGWGEQYRAKGRMGNEGGGW